MIEFRTFAARISGDTRRKQRGLESQRPEHSRECAIQLVAKSAASLFDDLAKNGLFVEENLTSEWNIKILKWNGEQVRVMDGTKGFGCRCGWAAISDAGEIRRCINHD